MTRNYIKSQSFFQENSRIWVSIAIMTTMQVEVILLIHFLSMNLGEAEMK